MEYKLQKGSTDGLLVVFSPINIPKGKFGFSKYLRDEKRNVLFFNTENTWYVDCIEEMAEIVEATISNLNTKQVVFYGASMGGYAALRVGGKYPQYPTFVFGAELNLYMPKSLSQKHSTLKYEFQDIRYFKGLDFSNTVILFGVFEPVDLLQYIESLKYNFYSSIPVQSPHAVHEELYYRELIRPLTDSTSCAEFVENLPTNFTDIGTPISEASLLYQMYTDNNALTDKFNLQRIKSIEHPASFWIQLLACQRNRNLGEVLSLALQMEEYFQSRSNGFTMPNKFEKQVTKIIESLSN